MLHFKLAEDAELRLLEESHAEEFFDLMDRNRAYLREWLPFLDYNKSSADTLDFIRSTRKQIADNNGFQVGIFYKGQIAGIIGYHYVSWANKKTSLGYWLGAEYQGLGLMTAATRALVDHAFDTWKLNRVEIHAATENYKSQAIPERLGFTREGVARQVEWLYDHFVDHYSYSMLASEWEEKRRG